MYTAYGSGGAPSLPAEAQEAWGNSYLGELPRHLADALLVGATVEEFDVGDSLLPGAHLSDKAPVMVVIDGLFRVLYRSAEGGTHGEVLGLPVLLTGTRPVDIRSVSHGRILRLVPERFLTLASTEAQIAWATARYIARVALVGNDTLLANVFTSIRARVACHLLDFAEREPEGLMLFVSHQDIADAIGSVREVVSRVMRSLRAENLVERSDGHILLTDTAGLHRIASGMDT